MSDSELNVLTLDTSGRDTRLALVSCTEHLSVNRQDILDYLDKAEKQVDSIQSDTQKYEFSRILRSLFKLHSDIANPDEKKRSSIPFSSSRTLVPSVGKLLSDNGLSLEDLDLIVVALGPGSFTGLRIGVVAAKTLAYASGCDVVGVDLMSAFAAQTDWLQRDCVSQNIGVAVNAGRGDILAATYNRGSVGPSRLNRAAIFKPQDWIATMPADAMITGDAIELFDAAELKRRSIAVAPEAGRPSWLETITLIGLQQFRDAGADDVWSLQPIYSRPSAAEESLQAKS